MKKLIWFLLTTTTMNIVFTSYAFAKESASSASIKQKTGIEKKAQDERISKLHTFFTKHNSPLADHVESIIKTSDKYNIDYRLLPAITGVESTFAKFYPKGTFNAYGWAGGNYVFKNWEDSFETVLSSLKKYYIEKGADTVEKIAKIYCPPNSKKWAWGVNYFMKEIEKTAPVAVANNPDLVI